MEARYLDRVFRSSAVRTPLMAEYRSSWRLPLIFLMLVINGRANVLSFKQIQVLDWVLRSELNLNYVVSVINNEQPRILRSVSIDPTLNLAINYAYQLKFLNIFGVKGGSRIELISKGISYVDEVINKSGSYEEETAMLELIGKKITSANINKILK